MGIYNNFLGVPYMGLFDGVKKFLSRKDLPTVLAINLDDNTVLSYSKAEEVIDSLNDYQKEIKRLPRNFAEFVRVSNNFCKYVIKALKEYQKAMVSDVDSTNCKDYINNLKKSLDDVKSACNNTKVRQLDENAYADVFDAQSINRGQNSKFVGDFAGILAKAADYTSDCIGDAECLNSAKLDSLLKTLEVQNLSKAKKLIAKLKVNVTNPLAGKVSRAVSSITQDVNKAVAELFFGQEVEPVGYYKFLKDQYLGRSTVYAILNILNSYKTDLKYYPKELVAYSNACSGVIDKITTMLKAYLSSLEVFMSFKRTKMDEIKARQSMANILEELKEFFDDERGAKNEHIFCLEAGKKFSDDVLGQSGFLKYNVERKEWFLGANNEKGFSTITRRVKGQGNIKNLNEQEIVLKGWSLGHFFVAMKPTVERTSDALFNLIKLEDDSIDYEKLEIKKPNLSKNSGSDKVHRDILEIIKKADLLKKHVYDLYVRVMSLANSEHFKKALNEENRVRSEYNQIFGKYNQAVVKEGAVKKGAKEEDTYGKFLKEYGELKEVGVLSDKKLSHKVKSYDQNKVLKHCSEHFSKMNAYAEKIEKACSGWLKYYSKDVAKGEKSKKEAEKHILQNIKLFKKKFSKFFGEAEILFKKSNKEFNNVMMLRESGANDDLLATYRKVVTNKYAELIEKSKFNLSFNPHNINLPVMDSKDTKLLELLVFDNEGFKEDNLYNCVKYSKDFDGLLKTSEVLLGQWLGELKVCAQEFKIECDKALKLFGKKNKGDLENKTKEFNSIISGLKNVIAKYNYAKKLYESYEEYQKLSNAKQFGDDFDKDNRVEVFENIWSEVNHNYSRLGSGKLDVVRGKNIIFENSKLLLDDNKKLKEYKFASDIVSTDADKMGKLLDKIKGLLDELKMKRENGSEVAKNLVNIRESYKSAKTLHAEIEKLSGDRFGKVFVENKDFVEFKGLWEELGKEYEEFCKNFDVPPEGKIAGEIGEKISVDGQKNSACQEKSKYFKEKIQLMHSCYERIKKLLDKLEENEKKVTKSVKSFMKNYKSASELLAEYASLNGATFGDSFEKNEDVVEFKRLKQSIDGQFATLTSEGFGLISGGKLLEDRVLIVSSNDEKVRKCEEISTKVQEDLSSMGSLLDRIKGWLPDLESKNIIQEAHGKLEKMKEQYDKDLKPLVEECKKIAKDLGIGQIRSTKLEKFIKKHASDVWEKEKKNYNKALDSYTKLGEKLKEAEKILENKKLKNKDLENLSKLSYTSIEKIKSSFMSFKTWAEANRDAADRLKKQDKTV